MVGALPEMRERRAGRIEGGVGAVLLSLELIQKRRTKEDGGEYRQKRDGGVGSASVTCACNTNS